MSTAAVLTLLALIHCLLLALASTLFGGYKRLANRLMAFALCSEALRLLAIFLFLRAEGQPGVVVEYLMLFRVMLAPTLYLYTRALTDGQFKLLPRHAVHALPLLISDLVLLWNNNAEVGIGRAQMTLLQACLTAGTFVVYGALSLRCIQKYRAGLLDHFSDLQRHGLTWLRLAHYYLLVIGVGYFSAALLYQAGYATLDAKAALMVSILTTTTFVYLISITGLLHFRHLAQEDEPIAADQVSADSDQATDQAASKYSSGFNDEEVDHYFGLLSGLMNAEQPFLQHKLKLADVGNMLGLHPQQVSQIINQGAGAPFHDYINRQRIEYALAILQDNPDAIRRVNDLYEECGFTSQSTFYRHFKKVTGETPRQYLAAASG